MNRGVCIGELYRHYRRPGLYKVMHLARLEPDQSDVVVYLALRDGQVWVRPLREFVGEVELTDGRRVPRFALVNSEESKHQLEIPFSRDDEPTEDALPVMQLPAPEGVVCPICLGTKREEEFHECPRCGELACPGCFDGVDRVGGRICRSCKEELHEEWVVGKQ